MTTISPENLKAAPSYDERLRAVCAPPEARNASGAGWPLFLTGLAVVGLGLVVWSYVGQDIRRYIRITNM
jgi:hypothetical protein